MADIKVLPGVNRPDLVKDVALDVMFDAARRAPLVAAVIVGREIDGRISVWGSQSDIDQVLGLLMHGTYWLAGTRQVPRPASHEDNA